MKLENCRQIFGKYSSIKLHENPSSGSHVVPCGQTDGHDEANGFFFRNVTKAPKSVLMVGQIGIEDCKDCISKFVNICLLPLLCKITRIRWSNLKFTQVC